MQTFLPLPSFTRSAEVLDRQRLGKQRVEAKQILMTLYGESKGWSNHPAVRMWADHESALAQYGVVICEEWRARGYQDTLLPWFAARAGIGTAHRPFWFGDEYFHRSHQSNLIRKFPEHYGLIFVGVPDNLPYLWPV